MSPFHLLLRFLQWLIVLFNGIWNPKQQKQIQDTPPSPPQNTETDYYVKALARFEDTYRKYSSSEMNANIDSVFYNQTELKRAVEEPDNDLELKWRRRHMNISTPRGNVIMYYDAFKMGFAYYCDQFMPYKLLNAVAMKYVIMYRCRDFFVDETVVADNHKSALLRVPQPDVSNVKVEISGLKDAPFAKLKAQPQMVQKSQTQVKETNRFINMGAVRNYTPLLTYKKKVHALNGFKSDAIPPQIMTYKQYKQQGGTL